MSMQSEGKDARGRNYDQVTKNGTSSAGSMGVGGTGDIGAVDGGGKQFGDAGNQQQASRTDDLLSPGDDRDEGFVAGQSAEEAGELQTGMAGIGSLSTGNAGSRQSAQPGEGSAMHSGEAGTAAAPESGGQRTRR